MICLENDLLHIKISNVGAEIQCIYHKREKIDYLWGGNPHYWSGHAPVLFPIVGRLNENRYFHKGQAYELPQHGFARRMEWEVEEAESSKAVFVLKANKETKEKYPFEFLLRAIYSLQENTLKISYSVQNFSQETMPYSLGSHPSFNVPLKNEGEFGDYQITFEPPLDLEYFEMDTAPYLSGTKRPLQQLKNGNLPMKRELFQGSLLIDTESAIETVTLTSPDHHGIRLDVSQFPFVCFWTKEETEAHFLCIEPFHGLPDIFGEPGEISEKKGILLLEPKEEKIHTYKMDFL